ncbi:MAG: iron ABC transporter permease [Chloroflexi bacterium]|nr:iron ABC transporter permease [Chloroflexota bacterium]
MQIPREGIVSTGSWLLRALVSVNPLHAGMLVALALLIALPVGTAVFMSFRTGLPGQVRPLTLINYQTVFSDPFTYEVLRNTVFFAGGTIIVSLLFTVPIVWLLTRTDLPFKEAIYLLMTVGILIPVFLRTIGWVLLLSPEIGILNQLAQQLFGLKEPPLSVYNLQGMAFVQGISLVPAAFFMLAAAYQAMDPALEEAAYTSGVGKLKTLVRINLPITLPAIVAVVVYLFMLAMSVFEAPAILGLPSRVFVLSSAIYFAVTPQAGLPNYGIAGAYGMTMIVVGLASSYLYFRVVRESRRYVVVTGRGYRPKLMELGGWKVAGMAFVALYFALEIFMPFGVLVWASLLPYLMLPSSEALALANLDHYVSIPRYAGFNPFLNTLTLVVLAPAAAMIISMLVSWIVVRSQSRLRGIIDALAFLPHAVPHILFSVALAYLALVYRQFLPVYGTIFIVVIAHAIAYISYGTRTMNSAMIQIHRELEEAGRVCGVSEFGVLRKILIPLIGGAVFNGWLWIGLLSYREVTMALVLYSPGSEVISTMIWKYWQSGFAPQVSAIGVVLIISVFIVVSLLRTAFRRIQGTAGYSA